MILPALLPDETLFSLLARIGRLNGILDHRDIAEAYFDEPVCPSFIDAKIHLPTFCSKTDGLYGAPLDVIEHLTWLGARARLGEIDLTALDAITEGSDRFSLANATFEYSAILGYCPTCVNQDVARFGMGYWHRLHQLPIVSCCPDHGDWIRRIKIKRASLHHFFPLPDDLVSEGYLEEFPEPAHTKACQELAHLVCHALQSPFPVTGAVATSAVLAELSARGLIDRRGKLKQEKLEAELHNLIECPTIENALARKITASLQGNSAGNAMCRAALIYLLFGSWHLFEEKCRWEAALHRSPITNSGANFEKNGIQGAINDNYRKICLQFLEANPFADRSQFIKSEYRCFRWLLHNDKSWLDLQLPILSREPTQLFLF